MAAINWWEKFADKLNQFRNALYGPDQPATGRPTVVDYGDFQDVRDTMQRDDKQVLGSSTKKLSTGKKVGLGAAGLALGAGGLFGGFELVRQADASEPAKQEQQQEQPYVPPTTEPVLPTEPIAPPADPVAPPTKPVQPVVPPPSEPAKPVQPVVPPSEPDPGNEYMKCGVQYGTCEDPRDSEGNKPPTEPEPTTDVGPVIPD